MNAAAKPGPIVLLSGPFRSTAFLFNHLKNDFEISAVILEPLPSRWQIFWKRARRLGFKAAMGQAAFRMLVVPWLRLTARRRMRAIEAESHLDPTAIPEPFVRRVSSVNAPESLALLRELRPAVVVIFGTRILTPETLTAVETHWVNLHAGITPLYRGAHGAYWALCQQQQHHCGVTIHAVDRGIDTGPILAQARIEPTAADNFETYPLLQIAAGLPALKRSISEILENTIQTMSPPPGVSRLWTHPTLFEYLRNRIRLGVR